jgi:choline-sulfatase
VIVLTADHGDMNGHRGLWTKMVMYEDSAGIPLIVAGPGVPAGTRATQTSLIDVHQTALAATGLGLSAEDASLHGRSLLDLAAGPEDPDRVVFSEYHDGGSITGYMMLREGRWKYVDYPGFAPQLFDLEADPFEREDLGLSDRHAEIRSRLRARMVAEFGDPDAINAQAFADQQARIRELGGYDAIHAMENYDHTPVEG